MRSARFWMVPAVLVAMALGAPSAFGATPTTAYDLTSVDTPFPQPTGRFGERHAATDDIDGDGVNDYFIGDLSEDVGSLTNAGRVYAISGKTRAVIYTVVSPEMQADAQFGFFISVLGDVNGDGTKDLAVGTDSQSTTAAGDPCTPPASGCNDGQGKAWVFSGKAGGLLYEVNNPNPQADGRFGSRIGRAGDVNGDGVPDSIMGASNNDVPVGCGNVPGTVPDGCRKNQGQAYIFDGADGTLIRTLNLPAADQKPATCSVSCGGLGLSVQSPGDVDGDGVDDQLVDGSSLSETAAGAVCDAGLADCNAGQGAMYLFSGSTGDLLARIDDPTPQAGATFGFQDAAPLAPGDVNGDGRADIFANGFTQAGPAGTDAGRIWVFDGKATVDTPGSHGVVLYEPKDPTPTMGGQCCFSLDKTDYNKDGTPDLYVGQSPHHLQSPGRVDQSGGTYVFDGRDGSALKSLELPLGIAQPGAGTFANLGSNLGWSVAAPGDLNGDGEPDYVAGATFQDTPANQDEGKAFVFLSSVPKLVPPTVTPPTTTTPSVTPTPTPTSTPPSTPKRAKVRLVVRVKPKRDRTLPYRYTARARVVLPKHRSKKNLCGPGGKVSIQSKRGKKTISTRRKTISKSCTAKIHLKFAIARRLGKHRPVTIKMTGRFAGNKRLKADKAKPVHVKAG